LEVWADDSPAPSASSNNRASETRGTVIMEALPF
jgi:hypothetical protein